MSEQTEHQLRQMYESVIREAKMVVWEYDSDLHRLVVVNANEKSYTQQAGIQAVVDNVPESLLAYIDEDSRRSFLQMYRDIDAGKPRAIADVRFVSRPGVEERYVRMVMTNIYDEYGRRLRAFGFGQDISWQKKEEQNFKELEMQMNKVFGDSFATTHLDITNNRVLRFETVRAEYRQHYAAESADDLFHRMGREIIQDDIRKDFFASVDRNVLLENFRAGHETVVKEFPVYSLRGRLRWVRSTLIMRRNPHTLAIEGVAYAQDMTQEKIREVIFSKIGHEQYNYIAALDVNFRHVSFFSGPDGDILGGKTTNLPYEDLVQTFAKYRVVDEDLAEYYANAEFDKMILGMEKDGRYKLAYRRRIGDELCDFLTEFTWLRREYGLIAILCSDVTDIRKEERERLAEAREYAIQAETANEAKTEFISRISHDIRTPIAAISGLTDLALEDIEDKDKLRDDLEKIRSASKFLRSLVKDVLDVSRIDSGRIEINPEPFRKKHAVTDIANLFQPLCAQEGILFVTEINSRFRPVMADRTRLNQVILNLISNAVRYTPKGGSILYRIHQGKAVDAKIPTEFMVRDTGIGMSEEYVSRCFEPFSQDTESQERKNIGGGTGLGLYIVHKLVTLMDGKIEVRSKVGEGTEITCSFTFPLAVKTSQGGTAADEEHPDFLCGKVLLVEDNAINTRIATHMLEQLGASVECAADGEEAVERFRESIPETYRLILMDIQMPRMNGYEATAAIRQTHRPDSATVPIYAMTANAFAEAERQSLLSGMNGYLTKPIERKKLAEVLRECLGAEGESEE